MVCAGAPQVAPPVGRVHTGGYSHCRWRPDQPGCIACYPGAADPHLSLRLRAADPASATAATLPPYTANDPYRRQANLVTCRASLFFSPAPDHDPEPDHRADPHTDLDAARPGLFDSDDDMATHDLPKFVRGHQTYGDAEFFCRKAFRLLCSGRYSSYDLKAKVSQISTYCDGSTAGRIDRLMVATVVARPHSLPWKE